MLIAIPAPARSLPRVRKIASMIKALGGLDVRHRIHVITLAALEAEVTALFDGIPNVMVHPVFSGVLRPHPASANEDFMAAARVMTGSHWFYLSTESLPLTRGWADDLDLEYRKAGKTYLGHQSYIPRRYRDTSGVDRIDAGDPYILEAAVYPPDLTKTLKAIPRIQGIHHEVASRQEIVANARASELITSAEWKADFPRLPRHVVVTRLIDEAVVDRLLLEAQTSAASAPTPQKVEEPPTQKIDLSPTPSGVTIEVTRKKPVSGVR